MPALFGLVPLLATYRQLPPGTQVAVEILAGAFGAVVYASLIWDAFQPGGTYSLGRYRPIEVKRSAPWSFWSVTVLYAAICAGCVFLCGHGLAHVFLWPPS
jgi:hypothetical protein